MDFKDLVEKSKNAEEESKTESVARAYHDMERNEIAKKAGYQKVDWDADDDSSAL